MTEFVMPPGAVCPGFSAPLDLRVWVPGEWVVLADTTYTSLSGASFTIPRGFITDLASIPKPAQAVMSIDDETRMPAALHDWLYCNQQLPRSEADALLLEALERAGSWWLKRRTIWSAVRTGGWVYFNRRDGLTAEDFAVIQGVEVEKAALLA